MLSRSCRPGWSTPGSASVPGLTLTPFLAFAAPPPRPSTAQTADTGTRVDRSCREADAGSMLGLDLPRTRFGRRQQRVTAVGSPACGLPFQRVERINWSVDRSCWMARHWREPCVDAVAKLPPSWTTSNSRHPGRERRIDRRTRSQLAPRALDRAAGWALADVWTDGVGKLTLAELEIGLVPAAAFAPPADDSAWSDHQLTGRLRRSLRDCYRWSHGLGLRPRLRSRC